MKKRKLLLIPLISLFVVILLTIVFFMFKDNKESIYKDSDIDSLSYQTLTIDNKTYSFKSKIDTYLLMGIDGRNGNPLLGQADYLSLVIVDNNTNTTKVLLIPRDTISSYQLCDSYGNLLSLNTSHINLAYATGGDGIYNSCLNEVDAIKRLFNNVPLTGYISMPLDILKDVVDIMGEKEVILEDDSLSFLDSNYIKGNTYTINKDTIEEYLRSRDIEEDFSAGDRTSRQIIYMKYLMSKFDEINNDELDLEFNDLDLILSKCATNLTNTQLSNLYEHITTYNADSNIQIIPGQYEMNNRVDEYIINKDEFINLLINIYYE